MTRALLIAFLVLGCSSVQPNLLGGRETCWSDEPRMATLMKGRLELGAFPWELHTPEGETFSVDFGPDLSLDGTATVLVDRNGNTVATEGELVTVFGGLGSEGVLVVCAIEERHPG